MKYLLTFESFLNEKKPAGAPEWKDSDAPDAEGRFRDLSIKDLAAWLIKTRKSDVKKISGSLTQQIVFNRNDDPPYAEKMEKVRKEVYKQLGREDLLESINGGVITCDNCGWQWDIVTGGNDPYICHKCGHDNDIVVEAIINELEIPSNRWVDLDLKSIDKAGMESIWAMYTDTYLAAGMDLSANDWPEMQSKYKATALKDVDGDNVADAFIIYKPTKWGNKIALLGTNGKKEAKSDVVKKLLQLVNTKGWFIEASLKMEEILSKSNAPVITDEDMIRDVVGADKKPEFTNNGYYTRFLSKAGKRITKRIYGKI